MKAVNKGRTDDRRAVLRMRVIRRVFRVEVDNRRTDDRRVVETVRDRNM